MKKKKVTKEQKINIRLHDTLKARYENALELEGMTMTTHLTSKIHAFVNEVERKNRKQQQLDAVGE